MATMYPAINNSPTTELAAAITALSTSVTVLNGASLPAAPNLVTVGQGDTAEVVLYTGKSGNNLTGLTRGFGGTVAAAWSAGTKVARNYTAYDHNTFIEELGNKLDKDDPNAIVTAKSANFTAPNGTPPLTVSSTTEVANLNVPLHHGWRRYISLAELGLISTATIFEIYNAMPNYSILDLDGSFSFNPAGVTDGKFKFEKITFRLDIECFAHSKKYYAYATSNTSWTSWKIVGVADGTLQTGLNAELHNGWKRIELSDIGLTGTTATLPLIATNMPQNSELKISVNQNTNLVPVLNSELTVTKIGTNGFFEAFSRASGSRWSATFQGSTVTSWKPIGLADGSLQTNLNAERTNGIKTFNSLTTPVGASNGDLWFPPPS